MERNYKQIDQLERDQIAIHRSKGLSFSAIGKMLGRSGSALSREYKRNLIMKEITSLQKQNIERKEEKNGRQK